MLSEKINQLLDRPTHDDDLMVRAVAKGLETPLIRELPMIGAVAGVVAMDELQKFERRIEEFRISLPNRPFRRF